MQANSVSFIKNNNCKTRRLTIFGTVCTIFILLTSPVVKIDLAMRSVTCRMRSKVRFILSGGDQRT